MKCLFIIQGEGRGHLTQAIALASLLESRQHSIAGALVGGENILDLPAFFTQNFKHPILKVASPFLVYSEQSKALHIGKTILKNSRRLPQYIRSLRQIDAFIEKTKPDIIINFYELLGGLHQFFFRPSVPMVCIAHQYLLLHKDFEHPKNQYINKCIVNTNTYMTAWGSARKLALSFREMPDDTNKKIVVVPPLLRKEITQKELPLNDDFILIYITQATFAEDIIQWHLENKTTKLHCFLHQPNNKEVYQYDETLTFHPIDATKFVEMMEKCRGLVSTAGFESICEAMYLGKSCLMIPIPKHYEQQCNALDGVRAGAGIAGNNFNLSPFLSYLENNQEKNIHFREWQSKTIDLIEAELFKVLHQNRPFSNQIGNSPWLSFIFKKIGFRFKQTILSN